MGEADISAHFRELHSLLDGKELSRLTSKARGLALLVLSGEDGQLHRLGIRLEGRRASIEEAPRSSGNVEHAVLRGTFADWIRFYRTAGPETAAALKFYGEPELLAALGELFTAQRSPLEARGGAR